MSPLGISAVRSGVVGLALTWSMFAFAGLTRAATVFDNYTGATPESFGAEFLAAGFEPSGNFDFTGMAAFVQSRVADTQPFTLSLYSTVNGGPPASPLWTSDELFVSATPSLIAAAYSGPAIPLQTGVLHFVVLQDIGAVNWFVGGSSAIPVYSSGDGQGWMPEGLTPLQFLADGDPGALAAPEGSTWLMMLVGFAGLGLVGAHRRAL